MTAVSTGLMEPMAPAAAAGTVRLARLNVQIPKKNPDIPARISHGHAFLSGIFIFLTSIMTVTVTDAVENLRNAIESGEK